MTTKLTLGTNNAFALKTWPEPEIWARIICEELGLKEVQFSFDLLDPMMVEPGRSTLAAQILKAAREYGLSMRSSFTGLIMYAQNLLSHPDPNYRAYGFRWYQNAVTLTSQLSCEATGGHIGAMSARDYGDSKRREFIRSSLVEMVRELTWQAAGLGQKYFLWEAMPTPREIPHTPEEAIGLMEEVNEGAAIPVYICFDLGHCNSFDFDKPGDPHVWLEKLLPWVPVVHLQQTDGHSDHHWPFTPEYNKVGIINPERVVEILKSSPFPEVTMLFELGHAFDVPDQTVIDDHKHSVETWAKWL
jgi:sugar phosphate isomerase/epimerase